ncbi:MAG: ABC-type transport auxiliary lipoprotein family protein [Reyranellaceae bacterium]
MPLRPIAAKLRNLLFAAACAAALAACGVLPDIKTPTDLYTLSPKSTFDASLPNVYWQLVVETPVAPANLNTGRMAISANRLSTDYYATAAWTDRAPLMVQTLIVESFENTKRIVAVGRESVGLRANYLLQTELREFQAETFLGPNPFARVRINAKIVRMPERQIIGSASFERCREAAGPDVPQVVAAFDDALGAVLRRMVQWVLVTPPPQASEDSDRRLVERFRDPRNVIDEIAGCPTPSAPPPQPAPPRT